MRKATKKGIMLRQANNSPKLQRNEVEKNRRMHMKDLYGKLAVLIPTPPSKVRRSTNID